MKYGALPSIDRPVSRLILGTDWMRYKKLFLFPNRRRREQIFSLLNRAWEAGINAFDGARVYFSEETLGEWIKELNNRDSLILISKGGPSEPHHGKTPPLSILDIRRSPQFPSSFGDQHHRCLSAPLRRCVFSRWAPHGTAQRSFQERGNPKLGSL